VYKKIIILFLITTIGIPVYGNAFAHTVDVVGDYTLEIGWDEEPPVVGMNNIVTLQVTHATKFDKNNAEKMHNIMNMENYDEKIITVLNHFDSKDVDSLTALSQISEIINKQNLDNNAGNEIRNLIEDIHSGIITNDDAIYSLIDMFGTGISHKMNSNHITENEEDTSGKGIDNLSDELSIEITTRGKTTLLHLEKTKFSGVYEAKFMPSMTGYPVVHVTGNIFQTPADITFHPEEIVELSTIPPLKQMKHGIYPSDVQCKDTLELFMWIQTESAVCVSPENGQTLLEFGMVNYF